MLAIELCGFVQVIHSDRNMIENEVLVLVWMLRSFQAIFRRFRMRRLTGTMIAGWKYMNMLESPCLIYDGFAVDYPNGSISSL